MDKLLQRASFSIKHALKPRIAWQKSLLEAIDRGNELILNPDVIDALIRRVTSAPTQKPDIINLAYIDWESPAHRTQQLASQLAKAGYRVFYIQISSTNDNAPLIKKETQNVYLIQLPLKNGANWLNSSLSLDEVVLLSNSFSKIVTAFNIHTAIVKVDFPNWRPLAVQLCQTYGWKLVYDYLDEQASNTPSSIPVDDEGRLLLTKSDLVLCPSQKLLDKIGIEKDKNILILNTEMFLPGTQADSEHPISNTLENKFQLLELELTKLFPLISIIVVTFNKLEYTRMCLESVVRNTEYPNYEIIIVDNASVDGSVEYIREFSQSHSGVTFISNDKNLGFAAANNMGAKSAGGDYLVLLNNDTIVTPGWVHGLLYHLKNYPSAGMVGPVTNAIGNEAKVNIDYKELSEINYFAAKRADKFRDIAFEIRVLALYCAMISRSLYFQLSGLDERYQVGMFEDDDLALKLRQAGHTLLCTEDVFIHHFHGISFNQFENQELQRIFHENRRKFEQKWGIVWQPHQNRPRYE